MTNTEIETTYLAAALPEDLTGYPHTEVTDIYFPAGPGHPRLRIRRQADRFTLTKKTQVDPADASTQTEDNVELSAAEFEALSRGDGKRLSKIRYFVPLGSLTAEVDVFTADLAGLVLVDVEFATAEERKGFVPPDWCGADVTQEEFIAGGMLAGRSLADIRLDLDRLGYRSL